MRFNFKLFTENILKLEYNLFISFRTPKLFNDISSLSSRGEKDTKVPTWGTTMKRAKYKI